MSIVESNFWCLGDAGERGALHVISKPHISREQAWELVRGEKVPVVPVTYVQNMGNTPMDLISVLPGWYLISDRFLEILRGENFTGWSTYPVRILAESLLLEKEINGYHGLAITGRGGSFEKSRRQLQTKGRIGKWKGVYVDEKQWDGSDIFLIGMMRFTCVTQPVHNALITANLRNVRLTRCDQVTRIFLLKDKKVDY